MGAYVQDAAVFLDLKATDTPDQLVERVPPATHHILNECCDEDPSSHLPHAEHLWEDSCLETDVELPWADSVESERPDGEQTCEDTWRETDAARFRFGESEQTINDQ